MTNSFLNNNYGLDGNLSIMFSQQFDRNYLPQKGKNHLGNNKLTYLIGNDLLFGHVLIIIEQDVKNNITNSFFISCHGVSFYKNITLTFHSRFYSACESLSPDKRNDYYYIAAAVTCLRSFSSMNPLVRLSLIKRAENKALMDWDESNAGELASKMKILPLKDNDKITDYLQRLGIFQQKILKSIQIDVVYTDSEDTIQINNDLVNMIGHKLDKLFSANNSSQENLYKLYSPLKNINGSRRRDNQNILDLIENFISFQLNYSNSLNDFYNFIILPLKNNLLNEQHQLNNSLIDINLIENIFPQTLQHVSNINKLLLDALKSSFQLGSLQILKACGNIIPYFYKIYLHHFNATKKFSFLFEKNFNLLIPYLTYKNGQTIKTFQKSEIISLVSCIDHLKKLTFFLQELMFSNDWSDNENIIATENYITIYDTLNSLVGFPDNNNEYKKIPLSGKLFSNLVSSWPESLRHGWSSRRILSIIIVNNELTFPNSSNNERILVLFNDYLVELRANSKKLDVKPANILKLFINSLKNGSNQNIPVCMTVSGYARVVDSFPFEFNNEKSMTFMFLGNKFTDEFGNEFVTKTYKLLQDNVKSGKISNSLMQAKVLSKYQPFHLFQWNYSEMLCYATIFDLNTYLLEFNRTPVCVFLNMEVPDENTLLEHNLFGAINIITNDLSNITIIGSSISNNGEKYSSHFVVPKESLVATIMTEVTRIYSCCFSFLNKVFMDSFYYANDDVARVINDALLPQVSDEHRDPAILETNSKNSKHMEKNMLNINNLLNKFLSLTEKKYYCEINTIDSLQNDNTFDLLKDRNFVDSTNLDNAITQKPSNNPFLNKSSSNLSSVSFKARNILTPTTQEDMNTSNSSPNIVQKNDMTTNNRKNNINNISMGNKENSMVSGGNNMQTEQLNGLGIMRNLSSNPIQDFRNKDMVVRNKDGENINTSNANSNNNSKNNINQNNETRLYYGRQSEYKMPESFSRASISAFMQLFTDNLSDCDTESNKVSNYSKYSRNNIGDSTISFDQGSFTRVKDGYVGSQSIEDVLIMQTNQSNQINKRDYSNQSNHLNNNGNFAVGGSQKATTSTPIKTNPFKSNVVVNPIRTKDDWDLIRDLENFYSLDMGLISDFTIKMSQVIYGERELPNLRRY